MKQGVILAIVVALALGALEWHGEVTPVTARAHAHVAASLPAATVPGVFTPVVPSVGQAPACGGEDLVPPLNGQPNQWKAGVAVGVWVDRSGAAARAAHRNPRPRFTLDDRDARSLFDGVNQWGGIPETGVTFAPVADNATQSAHYWISVTWPAGDIAFRASDGHTKTLTCRVPPSSYRAAAYTCSFQDEVSSVSQSHTIIAAITLVNTAHTYVSPRDGQSHETWAYRLPGWQRALVKIGAHENGHLMGLADMPSRDPDGAQRPHVMKPFNGVNDTAPFGGTPRLGPVTACDRATILNHPSRQYERWVCAGPGAVPPPPCGQGEAPVCRDPSVPYPAPIWECENTTASR